jgi:hypothetical protein
MRLPHPSTRKIAMKIRLHISDQPARACRTPFEDADHVLVEGACPECGAEPFKARGLGRRVAAHDTYAAHAVGLCCRKPVGELRTTVSTLFGIDEDERVLNGPWRIY